MQFMALIYNEETAPDPALFQAYGKFTQDMVAQGHFQAGDALQPSRPGHEFPSPTYRHSDSRAM
jgi:hypothetical protein